MTIIVVILLTITGFSQVKKDTMAIITDTTEYISQRDLSGFVKFLQDTFTVTQYNTIIDALSKSLSPAMIRYENRKKKVAVNK